MADEQTIKLQWLRSKVRSWTPLFQYLLILVLCGSYVAPKIVDLCKLGKVKNDKPLMVQLAIGTKHKVSKIVKECEVNLNILPLGSYDIIIGMDWLEHYHVMLGCLHKSILCTHSQWNQVKVQGIPKKVFVRQISTLQAKKCIRKGFKLFAMNIWDVESDREQCIEDFPILEEFKDVFPEEIPRLPLKRDLEFSIELTQFRPPNPLTTWVH